MAENDCTLPGLFDVLGPVMHGPSSNHTGGAGRIGCLARLLMGGQPDRVVLGFHPAYMKSYQAQHSHIGLIAGCLGIREYDAEFPDALRLAEEFGMSWRAEPLENEDCSRNTMRVTGFFATSSVRCRGTSGQNETWSVNGDSVGGGSIVINALNGVPVFLTGNETVLLLWWNEEEFSAPLLPVLRGQNSPGTAKCYSGKGTDGRMLFVLCLSSEKEADAFLQTLPAPVRDAVNEGSLGFRIVPPIYTFRDCGGSPLVRDFAGLLKLLAEGSDLSDLAVRYEMRHSGTEEAQVLSQGRFLVSVVRDSLERGASSSMNFIAGAADPSDGQKLYCLAETGRGSVSPLFTKALARAVTLAGMNAAGTGRIVACPTGGSAGTLPAVLLTAAERYGADDETLARAFLAAGLIGVLIGGRASFSGTTGGCQSEIGIGAAMGAAGAAWLAGASGEQAVQAAVIALKNTLGLSCDPPVPATEVPCIKRNAMGVSVAFFGADLGMAGVRSAISPDDVVEALADTQRRLPPEIKFGGTGGLAGTRSGRRMMEQWTRNHSGPS